MARHLCGRRSRGRAADALAHSLSATPGSTSNLTPQWKRRFVEMTEKALYACDQCYRCKTRCEKELPQCQRCKKQNSMCTYSVTGSEIFTAAAETGAAQCSNGFRNAGHVNQTRPIMHRRAVTWTVDTKRDESIMSDQEASRYHGVWSQEYTPARSLRIVRATS